MATRISKAQAVKLGARRKEVTDLIAKLTKEKEILDHKLLSLDTSEIYEGEGIVLSFTPVRTLDTKFITSEYPASKNPEFYKLSLDTASFKQHFSPEELSTFQQISYRIKVDEIE